MAQTVALEEIISCSVFHFHEDSLIFRFHDLSHVFATNALEHGMDIKTLSTIIGHVSSTTTLNIYAHVTNDMQRQAAAKIGRGIGKAEAKESAPPVEPTATMTDFQPARKRNRRRGTGSISRNQNGQWAGRYTITWPDGKLEVRNVHANTEEECERLLAMMIAEVKAGVAAEKERLRAENKASRAIRPAGIPRRADFLCLWANMWSESKRP